MARSRSVKHATTALSQSEKTTMLAFIKRNDSGSHCADIQETGCESIPRNGCFHGMDKLVWDYRWQGIALESGGWTWEKLTLHGHSFCFLTIDKMRKGHMIEFCLFRPAQLGQGHLIFLSLPPFQENLWRTETLFVNLTYLLLLSSHQSPSQQCAVLIPIASAVLELTSKRRKDKYERLTSSASPTNCTWALISAEQTSCH